MTPKRVAGPADMPPGAEDIFQGVGADGLLQFPEGRLPLLYSLPGGCAEPRDQNLLTPKANGSLIN